MKRILQYIYYYIFKTKIVSKKNKKKGKRANKRFGFDMKSFFDSHKGERCFIIATGPSLTVEDLNLLKNEYCISMNTIFRLFDRTSWRPQLYGIQDKEVYEKNKDSIMSFKNELGNLMIGDSVSDFTIEALYYHLDFQKHLIGDDKTMFSNEVNKVVYDGFTITYSLIQIAVFLGFKYIYLLGCDTNYKGAKTHFDGTKDPLPKGIDLFYDRAVEAYTSAKEFADKNGILIVNCTRGGMLEVFQRMPLEKVLGQND